VYYTTLLQIVAFWRSGSSWEALFCSFSRSSKNGKNGPRLKAAPRRSPPKPSGPRRIRKRGPEGERRGRGGQETILAETRRTREQLVSEARAQAAARLAAVREEIKRAATEPRTGLTESAVIARRMA
jgi:hypothetical protein